ncbi:hypothetical protein ACWGNY_03585 [[Kitasatospora] papulosa]|uniref:hypothetical protein n=1 Tax=Streptomyces TaxID=1883 RepID=UPI0033E17C58
MTPMIPAHVPDEPPLAYADSFDIPVLFRNGPAARPRKQWRTAEHKAWSATEGVPKADGWYAPTTTWREIVKPATEVGRDITPHLQNQPQYAHGELVARVAPLYAYIGAHPFEHQPPVPGATGQRLTLDPVYAYGTERTAKSAAAYRLGMTMTDWVCRSLLGLGQTQHLELGGPVPALSVTFKDPKRKLPEMLVYLALRSASASQLRTVPVPADRTSRHRRHGPTTPLEKDDPTAPMPCSRCGCRAMGGRQRRRAGGRRR